MSVSWQIANRIAVAIKKYELMLNKYELMLTRCAKAYSSSGSVV